MNKAKVSTIVSCMLVVVRGVAGDLTVDGNLNVTSNLTVLSLSATNVTVNSLVVSGIASFSGPIQGDGSGLTNLTAESMAPGSIGSEALASGAVVAASIAVGSVGSAALATGAVTSVNLAAGCVGTNKAAMAEWSAWGNSRYMAVAGSPDLVLGESGRIVAGYGVNLTNIGEYACGAAQFGANDGVQSIREGAIGAVQRGYNLGTQTIRDFAHGAMQQGNNFGDQTLDYEAVGAWQRGMTYGLQTIGSSAYGASQEGQNDGTQTIGIQAIGAMQRGVNVGNQRIGWYAFGTSQFGVNAGTQTISNEAYGASQYGWNDGTQTIGARAYGAEQRGFTAVCASATNSGVGSVQLVNLASNQHALITGHAALGLGACRVTNDQAIVAGDGLSSHGNGSVTAVRFFGDGSGLTGLNLAAYAGANLTWDAVSNRLNAAAGVDSNGVVTIVAAIPGLADGDDDSKWTGTAAGLDVAAGRSALGLGTAAVRDASAFAPSNLASYASDTVLFSNSQFHASVQMKSSDVTNIVAAAWPQMDKNGSDDLTTAGGTLSGDLDMNGRRVRNLPNPQDPADRDAISKAYLRWVLSCLPQQGNLSMGAYTNGAPAAFPLTF